MSQALSGPAGAGEQVRSLSILVVGDDPGREQQVTRQLQASFPHATFRDVIDRASFDRALEEGDFDLVVTGDKLDWIEGLTVLRHVRSRWPDRLVVMYTRDEPAESEPDGIDYDDWESETPSIRRLSSAVRGAISQVSYRREAETRYHGLYDSVPVGLYRTTAAGAIIDVNQAMVRMLRYPDRDSLLRANAAELYVHPEERARGMEMLRRDGVLQDFEIQLRRLDGTQVWMLDNVREVLAPDGSIEFFLGTLQDITQRKLTDEVLAQSLQSLNRAMVGTIEAMAVISEMRDPYTAGHQKRVARLAAAIATSLGLTAERIEGVRLAGLIHDIGKIAVPHEILSKPGRLTSIEFNLIRVHPEVGYEVLKRIDFPWPLAQVVQQHHEMLDGSGYPAGLAGEAILPESRIISVADVVEAMASHRPYRPSLGIDRALEQIADHRGQLYDSKVVDACLALFASGFQFE